MDPGSERRRARPQWHQEGAGKRARSSMTETSFVLMNFIIRRCAQPVLMKGFFSVSPFAAARLEYDVRKIRVD